MLHWSIDCPSMDCNKCRAMNGSVSLAVLILYVKTWHAVILSFVGYACVQVSVAQNADYLMFDNSHYLKTRAEKVSTLRLHPSLILAK